MRTLFSKLALTVALMLALTFTFSCSSGDDGGSGGQGGSFNENSQVYNFDGRNIGTAYKGSGIIKIVMIGNGDGNSLNAGSVTNGIANNPRGISLEFLHVLKFSKRR